MTYTRYLEFGLILVTFSFLKKICTCKDNIYVGRIDVPYTSTVGNEMLKFVKKLKGYVYKEYPDKNFQCFFGI